jgi:hypothetical protein
LTHAMESGTFASHGLALSIFGSTVCGCFVHQSLGLLCVSSKAGLTPGFKAPATSARGGFSVKFLK